LPKQRRFRVMQARTTVRSHLAGDPYAMGTPTRQRPPAALCHCRQEAVERVVELLQARDL
jgi:hypothetical protein